MRRFGEFAAMIALALGLLAAPVSAQARPAVPVAPSPESMAVVERTVTFDAEAGIQASCRVKPKYPSIGLAIRYGKSASSTQIGRIYGTTSIPAKCTSESGGSYRCRSWQGTRSWWINVYYKGTWSHRWVAGYCSIWYRV